MIDLCVFRETMKGRRVFLDYRNNLFGAAIDFNALGGEAKDYLERAGACFGSPYERLYHMNAPAVEFYRSHGIDLASEPLEIALCAQHNNGGITVDRRWQTCVPGLFAAGECAATHGVRRPGGSALNAGQAGSLRAAQYIAARRRNEAPPIDIFINQVGPQILEMLANKEPPVTAAAAPPTAVLSAAAPPTAVLSAAAPPANDTSAPVAFSVLIDELRKNMSKYAGVIRDISGMKEALDYARSVYDTINIHDSHSVQGADNDGMRQYYLLRELLISQITYLSAFIDFAGKSGKSRGGALYNDINGMLPHEKLPPVFAFTPDDGSFDKMIQEIYYNARECNIIWRETRPLPIEDDFFENVWRDFRAGKNIDE